MSNRYLMPKISKEQKPLFYLFRFAVSKKNAKFFMMGAGVGLVVMLLYSGAMTVFFPYKEVAKDSIGAFAEYIESTNEGMVLVKRTIGTPIWTLVLAGFGLLGVLPTLPFANNMDFMDNMKIINDFKKSQKVYQYERKSIY